ncbi:hypothetical protein [Nocardiopsis dassonvillei]|uniref:Uncharacterized protein n=1 Tax=Nocardiopsis dassonvillei (strain ATCC 23218 / DSM 43111 / CIP 107115 / JCM 7437 / KCTC 9190 / NBRC 14626 / NCTC 10488 / NRRL B-5397 / IMRU 509) TaxID=446468 RepID=D7B7N5_NOCDD|nr:hypothetical protein [Nocardiopsis dassonvillei]ADH69430.1 hypothetical protein Ndas_4033 [Nocardiopsis dassonvillei subsp. dassonvillei DSM 43111]NKY79182.1 hypothetical protein [Nocardiopsis dassonvillei]VEI89940.1 Uncharacterised protein [Nocardiopsis dassonvillei]
MTQTQPHNNGRGAAPRVDAASVEAVAGAPEYDSTSRLSCAAWTDPAFRADVLRERVENPHRTLAREPGLDAALVTEECVRARNVRATAGALFLGAALLVCPFNLPAGLLTLAVVLALAMTARYRATHDGARPRVGCVSLVLGAVALYMLYTFASPLLVPLFGAGADAMGDMNGTGGMEDDPWGSTDPSEDLPAGPGFGSLIPFWLGLLVLLAAAVAIGGWVRFRANTAFRRIRSAAASPRTGSGVGSVPVAFYNDFTPFVGTGAHHSSWPVMLKLLPRDGGGTQPPDAAEDRETGGDRKAANGHGTGAGNGASAPASPADGAYERPDEGREVPPAADATLVKDLYARLREELPKLTGTEGVRSSTRREVEVADCVFLPGLRQDDVVALAPRLIDRNRWALREEWVDGFVDAFHERARHFLEIGISMWESQVVVTVFVRLSTQGGLLHVEGETMVMPPLSPDYRVPQEPLSVGADAGEVAVLVGDSLFGVLEDLRTNPAEALAWVASRSATRRNNRVHTWARSNKEFFDYSPRMGVRERAATPRVRQLFQSHDIRRVTRAIPEKVLVCVRDVLREAGYDTEQVARIIQNISNYGATFHGGRHSFSGSTFGSGDIHHHTPPNADEGPGGGVPGGPDGAPGPVPQNTRTEAR